MVDIFEKNILYKKQTPNHRKKSYLEKLKNMYKIKFSKSLKDKKKYCFNEVRTGFTKRTFRRKKGHIYTHYNMN